MNQNPTETSSQLTSQTPTETQQAQTQLNPSDAELISQLNKLIYDFKQTNNNQQVRQFIDIISQLKSLGEDSFSDSGEESKADDQNPNKGLNHEHFYLICSMIAKRSTEARKKAKQASKRTKLMQEEKDHRDMIKEVARLLRDDQVALDVVADEPSVIQLLQADELIQSTDKTS